MSTPFNVIPGSNAEKAVQEIAGLTFEQANIVSNITPILEKYGVDSVTTSAVEAAATKLAENPRMDLSYLAQGLVGTSVADPRVAGNDAKARVAAGQENLSTAEQEMLAITAAGDAAEAAGADRSLAEAEAGKAISQGMSPQMAAYAGAAAAAAVAAANNPVGNPGIEIFGYLQALVQGLVMETYLKTEDKTVASSTNWKIVNNFIQTTTGQLHVYCKNYIADAKSDVSDSDFSFGIYQKGYTMEAVDPEMTTGISVGVSGASYTRYDYKIISLAVYKETIFAWDFYISPLGTTKMNQSDTDTDKTKHKTVVGIHSRSNTKFH
ncbi:hypothetical protein [Bordetella petrii]|uniref:hypothetical protein n=1 Tax=Bordetella petrii TaxID=94624 RepID=UPI001E64E2C9|nr:hypothetical protein [Bordetella petrii]MCD0501504.1 hypothetical protein [Bordetella petrii]